MPGFRIVGQQGIKVHFLATAQSSTKACHPEAQGSPTADE